MRLRLAFLHGSDESFLVMSELVRADGLPKGGSFSVTRFDHEDTFLKLAATADISLDLTSQIATDVLLSVTKPMFPHRWLEVEVDEEQRAALGLDADRVEAKYLSDMQDRYSERGGEFLAGMEPGSLDDAGGLFGFSGRGEQFHEFLMQAPTPFVMLTGPEHRMSFINPPYARLLGRLSPDSMLGKPVREALPELEGQPFFGLLDQVYRTGVAFIGKEVPIRLRSEATGEDQDCFVDFIYHPVRNKEGEVWGLLVQAMEVTERVLSRDVANSREHQLYTQWQELETIYKTAPLGVVLVNAEDWKIVRINRTQAEFLGSSPSELMGKSLDEAAKRIPEYRSWMQRVMAGEEARNVLIETSGSRAGGERRTWLVNGTVFRNASGAVEKLCSTSLEMPREALAAADVSRSAPAKTVEDVAEKVGGGGGA